MLRHYRHTTMRTQSEAGLIPNRVENGTAIVAMAPASLSISTEPWEGSGTMDDTEDDVPAAENWLDVTHAMLGEL